MDHPDALPADAGELCSVVLLCAMLLWGTKIASVMELMAALEVLLLTETVTVAIQPRCSCHSMGMHQFNSTKSVLMTVMAILVLMDCFTKLQKKSSHAILICFVQFFRFLSLSLNNLQRCYEKVSVEILSCAETVSEMLALCFLNALSTTNKNSLLFTDLEFSACFCLGSSFNPVLLVQNHY